MWLGLSADFGLNSLRLFTVPATSAEGVWKDLNKLEDRECCGKILHEIFQLCLTAPVPSIGPTEDTPWEMTAGKKTCRTLMAGGQGMEFHSFYKLCEHYMALDKYGHSGLENEDLNSSSKEPMT